MNTLSPTLISTVIYASDVHKVWEDLRERFDKVNASRACYLHKEISTLTQGISSVSVYFSRLRELWDEYETLDPPPTCGCPKSNRYTERYQLQKLYQFLTGLNESYENAKNYVLMTRPLPNINQAYVMIINVESQRMHGKCASPLTDNNEVAAMMSNKPHNSNYNGGYNNNGGFNTNNYNGGFKPRNSFGKSGIYCEYCKGRGHTKDNCYKLHGYPRDFKNRKRGGPSNTHANSVTSAENPIPESHNQSAPPASPAHFFTYEQYNQILQLLSKGQEAEPVANAATAGTIGTLKWKGVGDW
ncbi:uncharacterized protein [Nicotiana tomentosiformis]|uniref:uncharacterized protein n=1 Tax=Nicotiana tomentosiformis TaxID=4098 RepID=UPI001444BA89|nr:uncharacterized protein LOC117280544 [Nicotiana tomentosiformis]